MGIPLALNNLAASLKERKQHARPPYHLFLTSTISLTPEVLNEISGSADWDNFYKSLQYLGRDDRIYKLSDYLNRPEDRERYILLAHLIEDGYYSTILTTNPDSALEDALSSSKSQIELLIVDKDSDEHIATALDRVYDGIRIIKLHGSLHHNVLTPDYPNFFELREPIRKRVKRYINQDVIVIGSIDRENDIAPLFTKNGGSIYYVVPDAPPPQDDILRTMRARGNNPDGFIISRPYGQFETFCQVLLEALNTSTIFPAPAPIREKQKQESQPARTPLPAPYKPTQKPLEPQKIQTYEVFPRSQASPEPRSMTLSRAITTREEKQQVSVPKAQEQAKEEQSVRNMIVMLYAAVFAIVLLLIAAGIFLKLNPTVGFLLLIVLLIVLAVIVFGPLRILNGEQITQIFSGVLQLLPKLNGAGSSQKAGNASENDTSDTPGSDTTSSSTQAVSHQHKAAHIQQPADTTAPAQTDKQHQSNPRTAQAQQETSNPSFFLPDVAAQPLPINGFSFPIKTGTKEEDNSLDLPGGLITEANTHYKEILLLETTVNYATYQVFVVGKVVPDDRYVRLIHFLDNAKPPVNDLLNIIKRFPEEISPRRYPLTRALNTFSTTVDELETLMNRQDRIRLQQEIQNKFKLLLNTIEEIKQAFDKLGIKLQDDA